MANTTVRGSLTVEEQSNSPIYTVTYAATVNLDFDNGSIQRITLTGNVDFDSPTNMKDGAKYTLIIAQDGSGSHTADWDYGIFRFPGASSGWPALSSGANDIDVVNMVSDGTYIYCTIENNFENYIPS